MIKKAVYNLVTSVHPVNPYHFTVTNHTLDQLPLIGSGSTTHSGFSISDATGLKINQHRPGREVLQLPQFRNRSPMPNRPIVKPRSKEAVFSLGRD
jgi:hypothetical protein